MSRERPGRRVDEPRERVAAGEGRPPAGGPTLYDWCAAVIVSGDHEDPLAVVRTRLKLFAMLLALRRNEKPDAWSVYVERHIAGVRFILHDAQGREVDLQQVPADPKELA